jgi:hypothetical protein
MQQGRRAYEALYVYTRQGRPDSSCQMWWNLKAYEAYLHYQWGFAEGRSGAAANVWSRRRHRKPL